MTFRLTGNEKVNSELEKGKVYRVRKRTPGKVPIEHFLWIPIPPPRGWASVYSNFSTPLTPLPSNSSQTGEVEKNTFCNNARTISQKFSTSEDIVPKTERLQKDSGSGMHGRRDGGGDGLKNCAYVPVCQKVRSCLMNWWFFRFRRKLAIFRDASVRGMAGARWWAGAKVRTFPSSFPRPPSPFCSEDTKSD